MLNPDLTTLSTHNLATRKKLAKIALFFVWSGAVFALGASLYRLGLADEFPSQTFFLALIALLVSIPVWKEKNQIEALLAQRS